jgi:hypothetical protein
MSKSDTPLSEIDTERSRKRLKDADYQANQPIHGFDTETTDGDVFILSVAPADSDAYTVSNCDPHDHAGDELATLDTDTILNELTRHQFRHGIGVWYNIGFDADVIFSDLPESNLHELRYENRTEYDGFEISYLPGKALTIRRDKQVYEHYDVSQILPGGLDSVAADWIDKGKLPDVDTSRFGEAEYVRDNFSTIREYAARDAAVTRDVWEAFVEVAEGDLDVPCGKPYSTGYLAADYIRSRLDVKPGWALNKTQKHAWEAYHGGRFEVAERGLVGEVVVPDINSAYPAVMSDLPDPSTLRWEIVENASINTLREADYGFIDVTVSTDKTRRWQPFAVKVDDAVRYPSLTDTRLTVLREAFLFAVDSGLVTDYEIHEASVGQKTEITRQPFSWVSDLYDTRKSWESEGREKPARVLKIILNSMYGKMCQTDMRTRLITEKFGDSDLDDLEATETFQVTDDGETATVTKQVGGKLFNPFIASYITGMTRLELLKQVVEYDLEEATYMMATDSLMIDREAFEATDFAADLVESGLGNWDYDARGEAFIIGSGVYEVRREGDTVKTGTRGFREADVDGGLREAAQAASDTSEPSRIPVENHRPVTLKEALHDDSLTLSDVGKFRRVERGLEAGFDDGRQWEHTSPQFADLVDRPESSTPLEITGESH